MDLIRAVRDIFHFEVEYPIPWGESNQDEMWYNDIEWVSVKIQVLVHNVQNDNHTNHLETFSMRVSLL